MQNDGRNPDTSKSFEELHAAAVARHRQLPMMPQGILDALLASPIATAVILITDADGNKVAPAFQLDYMLRLRRSVFYVNMISMASSHPHDMLDWWTQPNVHLENGKSPQNLLGTAEERRVMELADLVNNPDGALTATAIINERYDRYMMHPTDAENKAICEERRRQQLARQVQLLAQVDMLSAADTIKVLKSAPEYIIVLLDPHTATIKVPAFQFTRTSDGDLVPSPKIQEVHSVKGGYVGFPNLNVNGAWDLIDWWYNHRMKLNASNPSEIEFTPISIVGDIAKLDLLIDWIKGWGDESYG
jgi:hypothetical protein